MKEVIIVETVHDNEESSHWIIHNELGIPVSDHHFELESVVREALELAMVFDIEHVKLQTQPHYLL